MLEAASLSYAIEGAAALIPAMPLIPEDALMTKSDVIPGLMRFSRAAAGELTTQTNGFTINSLASPILAPVRRLLLRGITVGLSPVLMAFLAPADFPGTPVFELKASIHNGARNSHRHLYFYLCCSYHLRPHCMCDARPRGRRGP